MFGRTPLRRAVSSFAVFIVQAAKNKALSEKLSKLSIGARGKELGKLWRGLSAAEKAKFASIAKQTKFAPRKRVARKANSFNKFVKANYGKVKSLPTTKRFAAIAKLWKARK